MLQPNNSIFQSSLVSVRKNNKSAKKLQQVTNKEPIAKIACQAIVPEYKNPDPSDRFYYHLLELVHYLSSDIANYQKSLPKVKLLSNCKDLSYEIKRENAICVYLYFYCDFKIKIVDQFLQKLWTQGDFYKVLSPFCLSEKDKENFLALMKEHALAYVSKELKKLLEEWLAQSEATDKRSSSLSRGGSNANR